MAFDDPITAEPLAPLDTVPPAVRLPSPAEPSFDARDYGQPAVPPAAQSQATPSVSFDARDFGTPISPAAKDAPQNNPMRADTKPPETNTPVERIVGAARENLDTSPLGIESGGDTDNLMRSLGLFSVPLAEPAIKGIAAAWDGLGRAIEAGGAGVGQAAQELTTALGDSQGMGQRANDEMRNAVNYVLLGLGRTGYVPHQLPELSSPDEIDAFINLGKQKSDANPYSQKPQAPFQVDPNTRALPPPEGGLAAGEPSPQPSPPPQPEVPPNAPQPETPTPVAPAPPAPEGQPTNGQPLPTVSAPGVDAVRPDAAGSPDGMAGRERPAAGDAQQEPIAVLPVRSRPAAVGRAAPPVVRGAGPEPNQLGPAQPAVPVAPPTPPGPPAVLYMPPPSQGAETPAGAATGSPVESGTPAFNPADHGVAVGKREAPVKVETADDLAAATRVVDTNATDAQRAANNYQHGHVNVHGLDVAIETPKGGIRRSAADAPAPWQTEMPAAYGYLKSSQNVGDGKLDVFIGDNPQSRRVFIVDQQDPATGAFDEHKVVMGATNEAEARALYANSYSDGKGAARIQGITAMPIGRFKEWLKSYDPKLPARPQVEARASQGAPQGTAATIRSDDVQKSPVRRSASREQSAPKPQNLSAFIRGLGGIREESGELRAMGLHRQYPGMVNNKRGLSHDAVREAAAEAGFLDHLYGTPTAAVAESTPADLRDMLADAKNHYRMGDQLAVSDAREQHRNDLAMERARAEVDGVLAEHDIAEPDLADRAAEIMIETGLSPDLAIERAMDEIVYADASHDEIAAAEPDLQGWDDEKQSGLHEGLAGVDQTRGRSAEGSQASASPLGEDTPVRRADQGAQDQGTADHAAVDTERTAERPAARTTGAELPERGARANVAREGGQGTGNAEGTPAPARAKVLASWHSTAEHGAEAEPARVKTELADPAVAKYLDRDFKIDRTYEIPYLAGYAKDGKTIFIDRHMPKTVDIAGKQVDPTPFLLRHESVEKALIDVKGYKYQGAHEVATGAEHADVRAAGLDPAAYEKALKPFIKEIGDERLTRIPATLDLTPYADTDARALEKRMEAVDKTEAGQQSVLPGAEKKPSGLAKEKAAAPLKGKVAQKLEPGGPLFTHEEDARQHTLLSQGGARPVFFSAALRSVENAKITKGTPDQGQALFQRRGLPVLRSSLSATEVHALKSNLQAMATRIVGDKVPVIFEPQIKVSDIGEVGSDITPAMRRNGLVPLDTAGGLYTYHDGLPGSAVITLAYNDPRYSPETTLGHEAWHHVEQWLLTDAEHRIIKADLARGEGSTIRAYVAKEWGVKPDSKFVMEMPPVELTANAFQRYRRLREEGGGTMGEAPGEGLHIAIRRAFERVMTFLRNVLTMLRRKGYRSVDDIFEASRQGKMAEREPVVRPETEARTLASVGGIPDDLRTPAGKAAAKAERARAKSFIRKVEDDLFKVSTNTQADVAEMRERVNALPKGYTKALDEKLYAKAENPKGVTLSAKDQAVYDDHIAPLKKLEKAAYVEARAATAGLDLNETEKAELGAGIDDAYMHRMVMGKTPQFDVLEGKAQSGNPIFSGRSLSQTTSSLKTPTYHALESESGERLVVSKGPDGIKVWRDGKTTPLKGTSSATPLTPGKQFKSGGKLWTVKRALTDEIEAVAPTRYYKSAVANTIDNILRLRRVTHAARFTADLKRSDEWLHYAAGLNDSHPHDWKMVDAPGLRGFWINPRLANPITDFLEGGARIWRGALAEKVEKINRFAVGSLFWSPIPHIENVGAHWNVARGWDWLTPQGWHSLAVDGSTAIKSVITQDHVYQEYLRSGASLLASRVRNRNFVELMLTKVGHEIERQPGPWRAIANRFGVGGVSDLVRAYYNGVAQTLWMANDVFMLQRIMELERKAAPPASGSNSGKMSRADAIREAGTHIPDYRIPSEVLGSRALSEIMQDPNAFNFSRYHYGIFKAYAGTVKELFGKDSTAKQRWDGLGRLLALGVMVFVLYPMIGDPLARMLTGNQRAKATRRGPATVPNDVMDWIAGNKNWMQVLLSLTSPAPVGLEAVQQATNTDLYLSGYGQRAGKIAKPEDDWKQNLLHRVEHAGSQIAVGGQIKTAVTKGPMSVLEQQVGISAPSAASAFYADYDKASAADAEAKRLEDTGDRDGAAKVRATPEYASYGKLEGIFKDLREIAKERRSVNRSSPGADELLQSLDDREKRALRDYQ